jgi:hypothetical protein
MSAAPHSSAAQLTSRSRNPGHCPERYATANSTDPSRSMLATTTSRGRTGTA